MGWTRIKILQSFILDSMESSTMTVTEGRGQNYIISIADEDVCWGIKSHEETQSDDKNKIFY